MSSSDEDEVLKAGEEDEEVEKKEISGQEDQVS